MDKNSLKAKRSVLKGQFTKAYNKLKSLPSPSVDDETYLQYEKTCEAYKKYEDAHTELLIFMETSQDIETPAEFGYMDDDEVLMDKVHLIMTKHQRDLKVRKQRDRDTDDSLKTVVKTDQSSAECKTIFKVNQLTMEIFSGDILKYLPWKMDMEMHYLPFVPESMRCIALKKQVDPVIQNKLLGCMDVPSTWLELDRMYGSKSKISDRIILDISNFPKITDQDHESFIKFSARLQRASRELGSFGRTHDLDNNHMIGLVEKKLPPKIRSEWATHVVERNISDDKFQALLEFLKLRAQAKEYEFSAIRTQHVEPVGQNRGYTHHTDFNSSGPSTCIIHRRAGHSTHQCNVFLAMSATDRRNAVLRAKACFNCLQQGHRAEHCHDSTPCYVPGCRGEHHGLIHVTRTNYDTSRNHQLQGSGWNGASSAGYSQSHHQYGTPGWNSMPTSWGETGAGYSNGYSQSHHQSSTHGPDPMMPGSSGAGFQNSGLPMTGSSDTGFGSVGHLQSHHQHRAQGPNPMLPMQHVPTQGKHNLSVLFDSGSTLSLICDSVARGLGLSVAGHCSMNLVKTGGQSELIEAPSYRVPLLDDEGRTFVVTAYGLRRISAAIEPVSNELLEDMFQLETGTLRRPSGQVDMLVGTDVAGLHPSPISSCGNLVLGRNQFGLVVWGAHPNSDCESTVKFSLASNATLDDFFQIESMGVECKPRCGSCRCGNCPMGAKNYTIKEERELELVRSGLKYQDGHWVCTYPWIKDPSLLPNNYGCILAQLYSMEKRLRKNPELMAMYSSQIEDMINRGVARKCSRKDLTEYRGPVFYLSHHEVLKESSTSTPCRVVFNPSQNFKGHILNDYWALGTNLVQSIFNVLVRFREFRVGIIGDISKMYHSVYTTPLEWHTHRFLWRDFENRSPDVYIFTRNSFGDRPAGTIAITAIQMTVEKFGAEHPDGTRTLSESLYVDDIVDSRPTIEEAEITMRDTEKLLEKGGFRVKEWSISSNHRQSKEDHCSLVDFNSDKVLGMSYSSLHDVFLFKMKLNFSRGKHRKSGTSDLTIDDIPEKIPDNLSKRMIVSQVNGIYDVLGLISPFVVRAKIMLRQLWLQKVDWDETLTADLREAWIVWFREAFEIESLKFERCISPPTSILGKPNLVMFSDASLNAMAAVGYLRFETSDYKFNCALVAAKTRVTPLQQKTIVQYEMQAAVMSKRLAQSLVEALRVDLESIIYVVDSEIVRAMIAKESYGFNSWYALRIGEIVTFSEPNQWHWIEGKLNVADWATRGRSPSELSSNSVWQKGPDFLYTPRDKWPTRQSCSMQELPGMKSHSSVAVNLQPDLNLSSVIEITRYSSLHKLLRVTARLVRGFQKIAISAISEQPSVANYYSARDRWIIAAQRDKDATGRSLTSNIKDGKFETLVPFQDSKGIYRVKGRLFSEEQAPIILPQWHYLSKLIVREVHLRNHEGISTVVSKVRETFWIVGAARLAKSARHNCVTCRKNFGELQRQVMAELPTERTSASLPFEHVSLDLFGPYELKIPGKTTRGRQILDEKNAYGVVYTCLASRAVYVDVARGYSLDAFLLVHRRFLSIRGAPTTLYSDCGPQLTSADKELYREITDRWDMDQLIAHGVKLGTAWKFCSPDSPWQNGVSEALVKGVKRSLVLTLGNHPRLTFEEIQTAVFEVANLLNERPIGRHPTSPDESAYLKPNDLLLGRCTSRIGAGPWREPGGDLRKRFLLVQALVSDWFKRWRKDYFPTLLPRKKWHTASRTVMVDDLVLIQNEKTVRGQWTLGQVVKTYPSGDGRTRHVDIRYKNFPSDEPSSVYRGSKDSIIRRSVQRLVVISPAEELNGTTNEI